MIPVRHGPSVHAGTRGVALLVASIAALCALLVVLVPREAAAHPFMIRHGYSACGMCHLDPSGGTALTEYGRAQSDLLLRSQWVKKGEGEEASSSANFLFGAVKTPEWLFAGGSVRLMELYTKVQDQASTTRFIPMQSDLRLGIQAKRIRGYLSFGYQQKQGRAAAITTKTENNLVSREHWLGIDFDDGAMLLRGGRIDLPFGIRTVEHNLWVRSATRTDINDQQQHGVSFLYQSDKLRGELMAILGNYQLGPDAYRERGYSGYLEYAPIPEAAFGLSSKFTSAKRDPIERLTVARHAHGVFGRVVPAKPLVLMTELDLLLDAHPLDSARVGMTGVLQADLEAWQGLHLVATGEFLRETRDTHPTSYGTWLSAWWFVLPHVDLRLDLMERWMATSTGRIPVTSLIGQVHLWL
ncbi:MAG: hypothetical protein IPJ34_06630 [Myxococcales bacterium]|nr:hypothetical protein [Myxococcales bacterium]